MKKLWSNNNFYFLILLSTFVISRITYYLIGIRLDVEQINLLYHYLDILLLKKNLIESVFYLHAQPPLFNLVIGIIIKLFPDNYSIVFWLMNSTIGLLIYLLLNKIMMSFKISKLLSFTISTIFTISTASILYENFLFYTYPTAFFMILSVFLLMKFIEKRSLSFAFLFFLSLSILALIRSVYHITWILMIFLYLLYFFKEHRREVVLGFLVPFILVFAVYLKNFIVFDSFSSCSWLGMNFSRLALNIPTDKMDKLIKEGKLDKLCKIPSFKGLESYKTINLPTKKTNFDCLDKEYKSSGNPNYNNLQYISLSNKYFKESLKAIRLEPISFIKTTIISFYYYLRTPSDLYFINDNKAKIKKIDNFFNFFLYGQLKTFNDLDEEGFKYYKQNITKPSNLLNHTGLFMPFFIIIIFQVLFKMMQNFKKNKRFDKYMFDPLMLYMILNIIFFTFINVVLDIGENNRMRFEFEAYYFIVIGYFLHQNIKGFHPSIFFDEIKKFALLIRPVLSLRIRLLFSK